MKGSQTRRGREPATAARDRCRSVCPASVYSRPNLPDLGLSDNMLNSLLSDYAGLVINEMIAGNFDDPKLDEWFGILYTLSVLAFCTQMCSLMVRAGITAEFHRRYFKPKVA